MGRPGGNPDLVKHQFKKGFDSKRLPPGVPHPQKPATLMKKAVKKAISETMMRVASRIVREDGATFADLVCEKIAKLSLKEDKHGKDFAMLKLFMEYTQEKPIAKQEVTGADGESLNVLPKISVGGKDVEINVGLPLKKENDGSSVNS